MIKNFSTKILIFILAAVTFLLGFNYFKKPFADKFNQLLSEQKKDEQTADQEIIPTPTPDLTPEIWANLSTQEKVLQIIAMPYVIENKRDNLEEEQLAWLEKNNPGLITFFGSQINFEEAQKNILSIQNQAKTKKFSPLLAVDHEGGVVQRFSGEGFEKLPGLQEFCQTYEATQAAEVYQDSVQQLSDLGINIVFAPVVDLAKPGTNLEKRSCGDEPLLTTDVAIETILVYAKQGIMPVLKHFPGMGLARKDLHYATESLDLRQEDGEIFKIILDQIPNIGVMTAHIAIDEVTDGVPCSLSSICLTALHETYPEALVFTDALDMAGALGTLDEDDLLKVDESFDKVDFTQENLLLATASKQAIISSNDVLVFGKGLSVEQLDKLILLLSQAYEQDSEFADKVDLAGQKVLRLKKIAR